jgi:hypothetical protein
MQELRIWWKVEWSWWPRALNPKAEGRSPNSEIGYNSLAGIPLLLLHQYPCRPFFALVRISDFGLLSDFGLRVSAF